MSKRVLPVFIGYDPGEPEAYEVCVASLKRHASWPIHITPLDQAWLRHIGLYWRTSYRHVEQDFDTVDHRPFSTEFSFSRFLVPSLQQSGMAVFFDQDFLWRQDIFELLIDCKGSHPLWCVRHDHRPEPGTKMRGKRQEPTSRKNWSSLMVFDCSHPANHLLTPHLVSTWPGWKLHRMEWLEGHDIGSIPERWNWLEGHSSKSINPAVVHYTRGTPNMPGHEDAAFASEWLAYRTDEQAA